MTHWVNDSKQTRNSLRKDSNLSKIQVIGKWQNWDFEKSM